MQVIFCGFLFAVIGRHFVTGETIRLINGQNPLEGELQLLKDGIWNYACSSNWTAANTKVMCRMLRNSTYRESFSTSWGYRSCWYNITCSGNEPSIDECMNGVAYKSCLLSETVAVRCVGDKVMASSASLQGCYSIHCSDSNSPYCDTFLGTCQPGCSPGRYVLGSYCYPCSRGTYQPETNQNRCYYCPFGTYQNLTGQSACQACPVGQYLSMIGSQTPCNACPPGTYQDQTGQISCKQCSIGTYQNKAQQAACIACEQGTYQNSSGKTVCIPCAGGNTTADQGSTTQYECYKAFRQKDDLRQQTNFNILIVGATLLAGVIIFDIISCAILMQRMGWKSKTSTKSDIHLPSLTQTVPACETANTNDTLNSRHRQDMQVNQREHVSAACIEQEQEYDELHSYWNTADAHDVPSLN